MLTFHGDDYKMVLSRWSIRIRFQHLNLPAISFHQDYLKFIWYLSMVLFKNGKAVLNIVGKIQAFVGVAENLNAIVIAFRGTQMTRSISFSWTLNVSAGLQVYLFSGFAYSRNMILLMLEVANLLSTPWLWAIGIPLTLIVHASPQVMLSLCFIWFKWNAGELMLHNLEWTSSDVWCEASFYNCSKRDSMHL